MSGSRLEWIEPGSKRAQICLGLIAFIFSGLAGLNSLRGTATPHGLRGPDRPGDSQDYDSIAWNLSKGRGFGTDWSDQEFRKPYEENNAGGMYDAVLSRDQTFHKNTYRPPLYPALLGLLYSLLGRDFFIVRLLNVTLFATGSFLCTSLATRVAGPAGGLSMLAWVLIDKSVVQYTHQVMTEPLAFLLSAWFLSVFTSYLSCFALRKLAISGFILGLAILARSITLFWVPPIVIGVFVCSKGRGHGPNMWAISHAVIFGLTVLATLLPWWARNCQILGGFHPTGSQGGYALVAAYSDEIIEDFGHWSGRKATMVVRQLESQLGKTPSNEQIQESLRSEAWHWIRNNPSKIPILFVVKLSAHWFSVFLGPLAVFIVVGCWLSRGSPAGHAIAILMLADNLTIAFFYEHYSRFLVPIMPVAYLAATVATPRVLGWITRNLSDG